MLYVDYAMTNIQDFSQSKIVDFVPMSNLGENSGILWIRLGNFQLANFHKTQNREGSAALLLPYNPFVYSGAHYLRGILTRKKML